MHLCCQFFICLHCSQIKKILRQTMKCICLMPNKAYVQKCSIVSSYMTCMVLYHCTCDTKCISYTRIPALSMPNLKESYCFIYHNVGWSASVALKKKSVWKNAKMFARLLELREIYFFQSGMQKIYPLSFIIATWNDEYYDNHQISSATFLICFLSQAYPSSTHSYQHSLHTLHFY